MTTSSTEPPQENRASHHDRPYRRLVLADDLVTDQALTDAGGDQFHHAAIAKAVADLALSSAAPVNIALFGPWGSGKSTFYNLMKSRILQQDRHVTVAYYDAWKYGGQDLKRNFIQSVARDLEIESSDLDRDLTLNQEQSRIRLGTWLKYNWRAILAAFGIALVAAATWAAIHAAIEAQWVHPSEQFRKVLPKHFAEAGLVLAAVLTALLLGPKALESAVVKTTRPAVERDDEFARMFTRLVDRIKKRKHSYRVIFFIDELDRCEPDDVVATLVDLKTFLDEKDCIFIVAADRDVLEHALRKVPQAKPIRDDDPYYSTPGAFIDKIFQHQIALPPLRTHALSSFAHRLVSDTPQGLWYDLHLADSSGRRFDDVVYILIPAHVSSPRRVKILLNNFATSARIAESRHIDWINRARELALLTVLETEFPNVAAALVRFPDLLTYLRGEKTVAATPDMTEDRKALIDQFSLNPTASTEESVAGRIVRDPDDRPDAADDAREGRAKKELARQLHDYLGKLAVVSDLHDPRPDLFYLRVVGYDEGITDPELGEMIDMAAERLPQTVVDAFHAEPDAIKKVAALLLIQSLAIQRGTGQANVLESACRITQELPPFYIQQIAHLAPEVLTHVGKSTWRKNALPGAVYLAAAQDHPANQVGTLMALLEPGDADDASLLTACVPALEWMSDDAAKEVHRTIGKFLPEATAPMHMALADLPPRQAERAWSDLAGTIETQFGADAAATRLALFDEITASILASPDPEPLLWNAFVLALDSRTSDLIERIHEQRDLFLPPLTEEHRTCVALYEIEIGAEVNWSDWIARLQDPQATSSDTVSRWAHDAAKVIAQHIPTTATDLLPTFAPVAALTRGDDRKAVFDAVLEQFPEMTWGISTEHILRWTNLRRMAEQVIDDPDQRARYEQALTDALKASVTTRVNAATVAAPIPTAMFDEWRNRIVELPAPQARDLESHLAEVVAPTPAMTVELLRLRIAARRRYGGSALTKRLLLPLTGEPTASVMAGEWLALKPREDIAFEVYQSMPVASNALSGYATSLSPKARTDLWIRFEDASASLDVLSAVGLAGVQGDAITHMAPKILNPPQQGQRNAAAARLLSTTFAETPTKAEQDKDEQVGHKEATVLALALIESDVYDNTLLAGRIVINSGGVSYRSRGKVRDAFNAYAHGDQSSNFNGTQATALQELGLLTPKKKGRWGWLLERLP